jgi:hemerythrin
MSRLEWKEEYSVGDAELDLQHQGLFRLIDLLEDKDMDASAMSITFQKLDFYVREHLKDEEEILKACHYVDFDAHVRQHDEFREWLETVKASFVSGGEEDLVIGGNLKSFLRDWLLSHILNSDQAYKPFIHK